MSEFLLNSCRQGGFCSATCQEQEIFEIYDLGEGRQFLVKLFGVFWGSSIRRDKLEPRGLNGLTALLDVWMGDVTQPHDYGPSRNPERHLCSELPVMSFEGFYKQFQRTLNVFRLEANHGRRIIQVLAKVHP